MRIDIVKYEEGFFVVVKIIKKELSIINVSTKVRLKSTIKKSVIRVQLHLSGRSGKFEDFLEFLVLHL